jgi:uncharacterized protein (TIGR02996 family)
MTPDTVCLTAILGNPNDDAPRLRYADWLEQQGDPVGVARAEFIRVQCHLARAPAATTEAERSALQAREAMLWQHHGAAWTAPLAALGVRDCRFTRGLAQSVVITDADFLAHAPALFALAPIEDVHFAEATDFSELARCRYLQSLVSLGFEREHLTPKNLRTFFASPHLTRLRDLRLCATGLTRAGCEALAAWPGLAALVSLALVRNDLDTACLRTLLQSSFWPCLRQLDLSDNKLGTVGVELLAVSPRSRELVSLDLGGNRIHRPELRALAASSHLGNLAGLGLRGSRVGNAGAAVLAQASLPHLASLDLSDNRIGDAGARALAAAKHLPRLAVLNLANNRITDAGATAFAGATLPALATLDLSGNQIRFAGPLLAGRGLAALRLEGNPIHDRMAGLRDGSRSLDLGGCKLGAGGTADLAATPQLLEATALDLSSNQIGDEGVAALAASPHTAHLTALNLSANGIGDEAAVALARSSLPRLTSLNLSANQIGDAGAAALAGATGWPGLATLHLGNNKIGDAGAGALARASLPLLATLDLSDNAIGAGGFTLTARPSGWTALNLANNPLYNRLAEWDADGGESAAGHLGLGGLGITVAQVAELADWPRLQRVTSLDLSANQLSAEGVRVLCSSPHLARLTALNLARNNLGSEAAAVLASSPLLARLTSLDLSSNSLDRDWSGYRNQTGVIALVGSPLLARLTSLNLSANDLDDDGARALAASPHLTSLTRLDLGGNQLTDSGCLGVIVSSHLAGLVELRVGAVASPRHPGYQWNYQERDLGPAEMERTRRLAQTEGEGAAVSQEQAFVRAVLDDPEDDVVRLVYADWLEERGDPRGEFIRVQMALPTMRWDDPRKQEVYDRQQQLLADNQLIWLRAALLAGAVRDAAQFDFRRGFACSVSLDAADFVRHADLLFRDHPLREARIWVRDPETVDADVAALAAVPLLSRLHRLTLEGDYGATRLSSVAAQALVASPYLTGLGSLLLEGWDPNYTGGETAPFEMLRAAFGERVRW